jgi:hypothetical protein
VLLAETSRKLRSETDGGWRTGVVLRECKRRRARGSKVWPPAVEHCVRHMAHDSPVNLDSLTLPCSDDKTSPPSRLRGVDGQRSG